MTRASSRASSAFTRAAIVPIEAPRRHELYTSWLAAGHAGEMAYLAQPEHVAQRADLAHAARRRRARWSSSRSRTSAAIPTRRSRRRAARPDRALRARRGLSPRHARQARRARRSRSPRELGRPVATRPCVDSAPVLEREWAERARPRLRREEHDADRAGPRQLRRARRAARRRRARRRPRPPSRRSRAAAAAARASTPARPARSSTRTCSMRAAASRT